MQFRLCFLLIGSLILGVGIQAAAAKLPVSSFPGQRFEAEVRSFADFKFTGVVPSRLDGSCGSAAVATVLQEFGHAPIQEEQVLAGVFSAREKSDVPRGNIFSLLDLKNAAEELGYKVHGLKASVEGLASLNSPVVVLLAEPSVAHFVVVTQIKAGVVYIADPMHGNRTLSTEEFQDMWNGIFLLFDGITGQSWAEMGSTSQAPSFASVRKLDCSWASIRSVFDPLEF